MGRRIPMVAALALLCAACGSPAGNDAANNATAPPLRNDAAPPAPPDDRNPIVEPKAPIDPKSAEAAGQRMEQYGALLERRRFAEAGKLWGDAANAAAFVTEIKPYSEFHLGVGKPGETEGAAGSIYVTLPLVLHGRLDGGGRFSRSGAATLRRVNDVPGSSEEQRRWHIERIELEPTG